jgi:ribose transport system ATP-binding protein
MKMPIQNEALCLQDISKAFFGVYALTDVNISIGKGEVVGLIGENGAGKSTMMNIIGGVLQPNGGSMMINGRPYAPKSPADAKQNGIAFIHQELNLFNNLSILDNMYISSYKTIPGTPFLHKKKMFGEVKKILESVNLDISPDTIVEKLCMGERQLVEIAKALSANPDIIIFDEPTTSLTVRETQKLFSIIKKLRENGKSIIYISHILEDVLNLADKIVVLRDGKVTDCAEKTAYTVDRMIASMVGRKIEQLYPSQLPTPQEQTLLEVNNLSQPGIIKDISFRVNRGEIVGIYGLMGSGRSEMANIIFGLEPYESGEIVFKGEQLSVQDPKNRIEKGMAFVTENRREEGLLMDFSIYNNVSLVSLKRNTKLRGIIDHKKVSEQVEHSRKTLRIKCDDVRQPVKSLSGGNQQKVVIGKWLISKPELLIVDEPTRGIDVGAKSEIYHIINNLVREGIGALIISSEMEELMGICNRIIVMKKGEITGSLNHEEFSQERIVGLAFAKSNSTEGQKEGNL